ncbi:MAG: hypothetical protein KC583_09420 [Myxococcales bacterium]|nr:hypothetical protein [Myxococcales bacterium]
MLNGKDFPSDPARQVALLTKPCEDGDEQACIVMAYAKMQGGDGDERVKGVEIIQASCRRGHQPACDLMRALLAKVKEEQGGGGAAADEGPGVQWVVDPSLASVVEVSGVRGCRGNPRMQQCSVVLKVTGKLSRNVRSSVLDADGVRLDQGLVLSPRYTSPGTAEAVDVNLPAGAVKVVFSY